MTAKEKAEELFDKFHYQICNDNGISENESTFFCAMKCALICVDEMIKLNGEYYLQNKESKIDYSYYCKVNGELFDIKQEIENL